jgi:hypothetical protein
MKAYQVHKGEMDKHGHQRYDLVATYFDKTRALQHAEQIAESIPLYGDILEFDGWFSDGKCASWSAVGWEHVCVSLFEEITITE